MNGRKVGQEEEWKEGRAVGVLNLCTERQPVVGPSSLYRGLSQRKTWFSGRTFFRFFLSGDMLDRVRYGGFVAPATGMQFAGCHSGRRWALNNLPSILFRAGAVVTCACAGERCFLRR